MRSITLFIGGALIGAAILAAYAVLHSPAALPAPPPPPPLPAAEPAPEPASHALAALPILPPQAPLKPILPTLATSPNSGLRRIDLTVGPGLLKTFVDAGFSATLLDELDAAFIGRYDLFGQLSEGRKLTLWTDGDVLVGAELETNFGVQRAALYRGAHAAPGWYDGRGLSLAGPLLGRPVQLSRITSKYGERFHPITGKKQVHHGLDYGVPIGTPVKAAGDGTVREIGLDPAGGGNFLKIAHKDGWESWYLHLDHFADGLKKMDVVKQGQVVAFSGNTGQSTGPHLHYELRIANITMDPQKTLPLPSRALGPLALPEHQAFLRSLP